MHEEEAGNGTSVMCLDVSGYVFTTLTNSVLQPIYHMTSRQVQLKKITTEAYNALPNKFADSGVSAISQFSSLMGPIPGHMHAALIAWL